MKLLDSAKYWLLDLVCIGIFPIDILVEEDLTIIVNKVTSHGLDRAEIVDILSSLFQEGMLIAELFEEFRNPPVEITPSRQQIEDALAKKIYIQYGLSSLGGEQWEKLSKPNWNSYIYCCEPKDVVILEASDRITIEQYLNLLPYSSKEEVISGSEKWESLVPWQATYWKILPSGWRLTCKVRKVNKYLDKGKESEYQEWLDKIYNWYTNPFHETN
jgi:hypothetical protein